MSLFAKDKGGVDFDPIPAGLQPGVCYSIVDLGTQPNYNPNFPPRQQVCFTFEIPGERCEIEKDGAKRNLPRAISITHTNSLSAKGNLRPMLEGWRGRPFTEEELKKFDLKQVLGANALLNIVHARKDPKTYANIEGVNPLMKGMVKLAPENPKFYFDLDEHFAKGDKVLLPDEMPEWLKAKIMQSKEWLARYDTANKPHPAAASTGENIDEDVPF